MTMSIAPPSLPRRPRAVLRIGFAGRRDLGGDAAEADLEARLTQVFSHLGRRLAALVPGVPVAEHAVAKIADFYSADPETPPLLRLVTGLCEGGDAAAARALERVCIPPDPDAPNPDQSCLETRLAAVLPFDVASYRASRRPEFLPEFDREAASCEYILVLDGIYDKPEAQPPAQAGGESGVELGLEPDQARIDLGRRRREKGYRAQSAMLLRHADLLVAAADPDQPGKAGGTLETARAALAFGLPVVFLHTGDGSIRILEPRADLASALSDEPLPTDALPLALGALASQLLAASDRDWDADTHAGEDPGPAMQPADRRLLELYFQDTGQPPRHRRGKRAGQRRPGLRERCWDLFRGPFTERKRAGGLWGSWPGGQRREPPAAPCVPGFEEQRSSFYPARDRARLLNHHLAGQYRGAFVLAYALATLAVLLGALSLVLLGAANQEVEHSEHAGLVQALVGADAAAAADAMPGDSAPSPEALRGAAAGLGILQLLVLGFIVRNSRRANRERWNDLAVDFRYLAERLRAMLYLPLTGSLRPPTAGAPQFASRVARQSGVDWLFDALLRAGDMRGFIALEPLPSHDGRTTLDLKVWRLDPLFALEVVQRCWAEAQVAYHARNACEMRRVERFADRWGLSVGVLVVLVVLADLLLVLAPMLPAGLWEAIGMPTPRWNGLELGIAPWLGLAAAVLPAVVVGLEGLRFQSECERLAQRSEHLRRRLGGPPPRPRAAEPDHGFGESIRRALDSWRAPLLRVQPEPHPRRGRWAEAAARIERVKTQRAHPDRDLGAWSLDALQLAEQIADDCVQEVAEWSVLYSKEVPET